MLLQELWLQKLSWDEQLPSHLSHKWCNIREDLKALANVRVPRWVGTLEQSTVELHGFSDASQLAMSAVLYLVTHSPSTGSKVTLLSSKTKVTPLKPLTIPRLELTASVILAKLTHYTLNILDMHVQSTTLWTDSTVSLSWINSHPARWKDFVRNRVELIQQLTPNAKWRYVPGKENPADLATRGLLSNQLLNNSLWWTGPPWLSKSADSWPTRQPASTVDLESEAKPNQNLLVATTRDYPWDLIYRYSSLSKLFRITSICLRVLARLRYHSNLTMSTPLSSTDLEKSRLFWLKTTQEVYFPQEIKALQSKTPLSSSHAFSRLTAFLDHDGVIRVGGRITNAHLDPDSTHPAILPRNSQFTSLVIKAVHLRTLHGGTQLTLSTIRQQYWIIGGRAPVKSHILKCVICARQRGIRAQQLMGQLPEPRLKPSRPFLHTGIDYAGPLTIKTWKGRGAKTHKGWVCVFVCFATSAVHLEAVSGYSTESFIAAYRRFTSRRGICHTIYSDCGTNFIGADVHLKNLFTHATSKNRIMADLLMNEGTNWCFNPPAAPHMGGKWEAAVKSFKYHLARSTKDHIFTMEELMTLLTQIEAILNSRPLEPLSDDPEDCTALTPGHFLIGSPLNMIPEPSLQGISTSRLSRWQFIQERIQQFWSRWSTQFLQRHLSISKWYHPSNELKVGSLVLLTDERLPPCKWPLGRVMAVHPGVDGLVRVVTVKTSTSIFKRPITKLAIPPINSTSESAQEDFNSNSAQ